MSTAGAHAWLGGPVPGCWPNWPIQWPGILPSLARSSGVLPNPPQEAADVGPQTLWFSPPGGAESRRRTLTREQVVAEALAVIAADGAGALSMRALAARLGVAPVRCTGTCAARSSFATWPWMGCRPR
jgi:hypothetical protein